MASAHTAFMYLSETLTSSEFGKAKKKKNKVSIASLANVS